MSFLHAIASLPRGVLAAAGAVFVLLLFWIWARFGRHRYVVVRASEPIQTIAVQLGRIADSIDHLARSLEARSISEDESKHVSMSILGR